MIDSVEVVNNSIGVLIIIIAIVIVLIFGGGNPRS